MKLAVFPEFIGRVHMAECYIDPGPTLCISSGCLYVGVIVHANGNSGVRNTIIQIMGILYGDNLANPVHFNRYRFCNYIFMIHRVHIEPKFYHRWWCFDQWDGAFWPTKTDFVIYQNYRTFWNHVLMIHTLHSDVIMSASTSQITGVLIVCSSVCSGTDQRKHQSSASLVFEGNPLVTGGFPSQRASNMENVSILWCQYACLTNIFMKMLHHPV